MKRSAIVTAVVALLALGLCGCQGRRPLVAGEPVSDAPETAPDATGDASMVVTLPGEAMPPKGMAMGKFQGAIIV